MGLGITMIPIHSSMRLVLALTLVVIYTNASQMSEGAIPEEEESFFAVTDDTPNDDLIEARQTIADMKNNGNSENDCQKLATATKNEVKDSVKALQKTIDDLGDGTSCKANGQRYVKESTEAKREADKALKDAKDAKQKSEKVKFKPISMADLQQGCSSIQEHIFDSSTYKDAVDKGEKATALLNKAQGAADEAAKTLKNAENMAADSKHDCWCKLKVAQKKAYETAQKSHAKNKQAWVKASHIECVLAGKKSCKVTPLLDLNMPPLIKEAIAYDCKKGAMKEIARKAAENKVEAQKAAKLEKARIQGIVKQAKQKLKNLQNDAKRARAAEQKRCENSVPNCQPGQVKCERLGANCRGGFTYNKGVCTNPGGTTKTNRPSKPFFAWTNCCEGCRAGESCTGRKYMDAANSHSVCTCTTSKYTPPAAYIPDENKMVGKCKVCNSGHTVDGAGQCKWTTVCQQQSHVTARYYAWVNCCSGCSSGYSCNGVRHSYDITSSSTDCSCSRTVCKRCANCGYN